MLAGQAIDRRTLRGVKSRWPARPWYGLSGWTGIQLIKHGKDRETLEGSAGLGGKAPERADLPIFLAAAVEPRAEALEQRFKRAQLRRNDIGIVDEFGFAQRGNRHIRRLRQRAVDESRRCGNVNI